MNLSLIILNYEPAAVYDHIEDGSFESFDVVTAKVVGGSQGGRLLRIFVKTESALTAPWDRLGETFKVEVDFALLDSEIIFSEAFTFEEFKRVDSID